MNDPRCKTCGLRIYIYDMIPYHMADSEETYDIAKQADKDHEAILDYECRTCHDTGLYIYGSTSMNMGIGGQMMTTGPCPGTGRRPDLTDCPIVMRGESMMFCDYCGETYDKSDDSRHDCLREL